MRFALEAGENLGIVGDVVGKKFQSDETVQAGVFGFVDDAHATAAELFENAVVGQGLSQEGMRVGHGAAILGCEEGKSTNGGGKPVAQQGTMRSRLRVTRRVALRVSTTILEPSTMAW